MVTSNRVSHAQIFLGPEGSGNLALALAFAQYVVCENKSGEDSCGICAPCIKASKFIHPDIHFSFPVISKPNEKPRSALFIQEWRVALTKNPYLNVNDWQQEISSENKQLNISTYECHEIINSFKLKSFESAYKILILWLPEYLGKEGNVLLKLIEEPAEKTLLILVANNHEQILTTILSRTQLLKINRLKDEELSAALNNIHGLSPEESKRIVNLANGDYNECLKMIGNEKNANEELWSAWLNHCLKKDIVELSNWVDEIAATGRENQKSFLIYALHFIREMMAFQYTKSPNVRLQGDEINLVKKIYSLVSFEKLQLIYTLLNRSHYYIERNASSKILFMNLSVQLLRILTSQGEDYSNFESSLMQAEPLYL